MEYYVSKRDPDELLACEHAVIDYEIEGAKVKTNVLLEAATTANSVRSLNDFKTIKLFKIIILAPEYLQRQEMRSFRATSRVQVPEGSPGIQKPWWKRRNLGRPRKPLQWKKEVIF